MTEKALEVVTGLLTQANEENKELRSELDRAKDTIRDVSGTVRRLKEVTANQEAEIRDLRAALSALKLQEPQKPVVQKRKKFSERETNAALVELYQYSNHLDDLNMKYAQSFTEQQPDGDQDILKDIESLIESGKALAEKYDLELPSGF